MVIGYEVSFDKIDILKWTVVFNLVALIIVYLYFTRNPKQLIRTVSKLVRLYAGFTERQVHLKGCKHPIVYIERGFPSKLYPSLLFVHGFSANKDHILETSLSIASKYHIVALDLPGHGDSLIGHNEMELLGIKYYTQTLKNFSDAIGLSQQRFHLMGESMGGHIVGYYASVYPQDLATLSMLCPHGTSFNGWEELKKDYKKTGNHLLLARTFTDIKALVKVITYKPCSFPDIVLKGILQIRQERIVFHKKLFESLLYGHDSNLLEERLEYIQVPAMLLFGEKDAILDVSSVDIIKSKMSTLKKCIRIPNTGHTLTIESAEKIANHFMDFIGSQ